MAAVFKGKKSTENNKQCETINESPTFCGEPLKVFSGLSEQ
jgi:hypothetical protein